jgi:hypothetical protein
LPPERTRPDSNNPKLKIKTKPTNNPNGPIIPLGAWLSSAKEIKTGSQSNLVSTSLTREVAQVRSIRKRFLSMRLGLPAIGRYCTPFHPTYLFNKKKFLPLPPKMAR